MEHPQTWRPVRQFPAILCLIGACLLAAPVDPAAAVPVFRDVTPVLSLVPGQTLVLPLESVGIDGETELVLRPAHPDLQARQDGHNLELIALKPLPWCLLSLQDQTGVSVSLLLRSRDGLARDFEYRGARGAQVSIFGSFNEWNRDSHPLQEAEPGVYRRTLMLSPGELIYLLRVNGQDMRDPANPDSVPNGFGNWNSRISVVDAQAEPLLLHRLGWSQNQGERLVSFLMEGAGPDATWAGLHGNHALEAERFERRGDTLRVRLRNTHTDPDLLRLGISSAGRRSPLQTVFLDQDFIWQDAVVYAMMPDRFRNGDKDNDDPVSHPELLPQANWQGGDLAGILASLQEGYFDSLGVNTLWIYPLNESTDKAWQEYPEPRRWYTGYHGYWPVHPTRIEPRFGDSLLFREVVAEAHGRHMRVMLDLVANHIHEEHPWSREHPEWFGSLMLPDGRRNLRIWDEHRLTTWFEPYMPDIDYSGHPEAIAAMCDVALHWVNTYQLDAFRHDAVKHVPREFWTGLTRRLKQEVRDRQLYQIGETFGSDELILSYVAPDAMDAQFNFNLFHPAREIFLDSTRSFSELARILEQNLSNYGPNNLMGNLMDSHDKARYASYADGDLPFSGVNLQELGWSYPPQVDHPETYRKIRLYLTWLMTIPGVPFLYYGDEIGMSGAEDPDNRRMMRFGAQLTPDESSHLSATADLVKLRRDRPELRRGDLRVLHADQDVLVFMRSAEAADGQPSRSLVALNKAGTPRSVSMTLPMGLGTRTFDLAAWEGRVETLTP